MKKLRAQQIVIDLPTESSPVWVLATWQRVHKDANYQTAQTVDKVDYTSTPLMSFVTQFVTITDPVTQQQITVSGAGAAELIKQFTLGFVMPKYPNSYINDQGDLIIED